MPGAWASQRAAGPFLRKHIYMTLAYVEITATTGNPERDIREMRPQLKSAREELCELADNLLASNVRYGRVAASPQLVAP